MSEIEAGECSGASDEIWAKLVPSDSIYSDVELFSNQTMVCSQITPSSLSKHEWCTITRNSDLLSATLQNKSSNTILVDDALVQNEADIVITCGTEIVSGPDRQGYLSYRFKVMPRPTSCTNQLKMCLDAEHAKCSICLNIWHDVVTIAPCFHNFCNGCFSEWLRRSEEKHSNVLCPQCRALVQFVGRNHFVHNIEEGILQVDLSLKRSDEEIALLDSYAIVRSNLVIQTGKKNYRKRPHSPPQDEVGLQLSCLQCDTGFGGFHCNPNTVHIQCQGCGGLMPSRANISVPQHCLGCNRAFCGAYWHAQRVTRSDSHPVCSFETFKPISERTISRIPFLVHEKNRHEQHVTEKCIRQMGKTLQEIISHWIGKLNNREIDRTRMPLNHADMITAGTHICNDCYDKFVSFLLYWFRVSISKHLLPADASNREDCWYGYACRTQHHSEEHARKRNHVCRPTRGMN